jgi:O-antigen ligase
MTKKTKIKDQNQLITKLIRGHIYMLVFLMPLIFWPDTMTVFTLPKLLLLRTISVSALFFTLWQFFVQKHQEITLNKGFWFLLAWGGSLILSTIFSINHWSSIFGQYGRYLGLITELNFLLIPVYIANLWDKKIVPRLVFLSIVSAVLASLYGILQYFNFFELIDFPNSWSDSPQNRIFGTVGHANHLGAYLAMHAVLLIYFFRTTKKYQILLKAIVLLPMVLAILLTASRGAILAYLISFLLISLHKLSTIFRKSRSKAQKLSYISAFLVFVVGSGLVIHSESQRENSVLFDLGLFKRTEQTVASISKGYVPERISFMHSSIAMFIDRPLLGTGLSTFRDAYSAYRRTDFQIDGPGNAQYITVPEAAHNEYLNILSTQGFLGLISFLGLIIFSFYTVFQNYQTNDLGARSNLKGLIAALIVFLIQIIFNFAELVNLTSFFLVIGAIWIYAPASKVGFRITNFWKLIIIIFALPLLAFFSVNFIWAEWVADSSHKKAELASFDNNQEMAEYNYQKAITARPFEYQLYQNYANFLLYASSKTSSPDNFEYLKKAVRNYQKSIELNDNYASTYHNLGLAYLSLFRLTSKSVYLELAKTAYERSVDKSPNNPRYIYEFARKLHSEWNDRSTAVKLLKQAIEIAPEYPEPRDYLDFLIKNHPELASPLQPA